ncbi:MAG: hypothetical protein R3B06_03855 [Kofleriaceae bacterium]
MTITLSRYSSSTKGYKDATGITHMTCPFQREPREEYDWRCLGGRACWVSVEVWQRTVESGLVSKSDLAYEYDLSYAYEEDPQAAVRNMLQDALARLDAATDPRST